MVNVSSGADILPVSSSLSCQLAMQEIARIFPGARCWSKNRLVAISGWELLGSHGTFATPGPACTVATFLLTVCLM